MLSRRQRRFNIQDEGISDEYNEYSNFSSSVQASEEEIDDGRYEHGCYRAVVKSLPPVKFQGLGLAKK